MKQRHQIQEVCSDRNTIGHRHSKHAKNIKDIVGYKRCSLAWILKREYIIDKEIYYEYISELFHNREKKSTMHKNVEGFVVLVSEIRSASAKVIRNEMLV